MIKITAFSVLTLCLAGCAAQQQGAPFPSAKDGARLYVKPYLSVSLCPTKDVGFTGTGCQRITSGGYTVIATEGTGYPRFDVVYRVKFDDGKEGYMSRTDVNFSEDEAAHAKSAAAEAATKQRVAAEKAECNRRGGVRIGMTRDQVYASCWGKPRRINKTIGTYGTHEQLVYGGGYGYLENGVVRSIQVTE